MFRIVKKQKGYVVEVKKYRFGLFPYWTWHIPVAGLDLPRHFLSYKSAFKDLLEKMKCDYCNSKAVKMVTVDIDTQHIYVCENCEMKAFILLCGDADRNPISPVI